MNELLLKSFDPNILPMDAFTLSGGPADTERLIGLKAPWKFDGESVSSPISGYVAGRGWWTKFADGTLIQDCVRGNISQTSADGNDSRSAAFDMSYPIPFYSISGYQAFANRVSGDNCKGVSRVATLDPGLTAMDGLIIWFTGSTGTGVAKAFLRVVGRWKA